MLKTKGTLVYLDRVGMYTLNIRNGLPLNIRLHLPHKNQIIATISHISRGSLYSIIAAKERGASS